MTTWNNLRSIFSTTLLLWSIKVAPPAEQGLLSAIVAEYLRHMIKKERDVPPTSTSHPKPPPPAHRAWK